MKFEEMNIEKSVSDSLTALGYETPTRIQSEAIPVIKQGYDVIGQSETGSGKTAAFGIPLVEKAVKNGKVQALVLAPTRELSIQIADELRKFSKFKGLSVQTVYGGVSIEPQIYGLRKAEIVVGTPGRIMDHMRRGTVDFSNLKMFVLDEADRMIDMGFIEDIETIERNIPKGRQTLLFSATMPDSLMRMRERFTKNAKKIKTETHVRDDLLKQYYCDVDQTRKFSLLVHLLNTEKPELAIVFCNSKRDVDSVAKNLQNSGISAEALHGDLSQQRRETVVADFHKGLAKVLVATDVAARGLDIKNVTHIFNYSVPKNAEDYTNRIGRTARAGESGKAIALLCREDHNSFRRIISLFAFDIEKLFVTDFKLLPFVRYGGERYGGSRFGGDRFGRGRSFGRRSYGRRF